MREIDWVEGIDRAMGLVERIVSLFEEGKERIIGLEEREPRPDPAAARLALVKAKPAVAELEVDKQKAGGRGPGGRGGPREEKGAKKAVGRNVEMVAEDGRKRRRVCKQCGLDKGATGFRRGMDVCRKCEAL